MCTERTPNAHENGHLQAKERDLEQIFPHSPQKDRPCQHFDFGLLASAGLWYFVTAALTN